MSTPNYMHRNLATLLSFISFCYKHPELRFWQALVTWSNGCKIDLDGIDTFYWEGRDHDDV